MTDQNTFNNVTLETSLKPFKSTDPESIQDVCDKLADTWKRLIDRADAISILWWVSDGNEIYEWHGDYDEELIWGSYIGFCNFDTPNIFPQDNRHYRINKAVPYEDNPAKHTFGSLKVIITTLRETLTSRFKKSIRMGATIDPGPEFAPARFKIQDHPELLTPGAREKSPAMMHFMTHQATLNQDKKTFAGFPQGVPQGTSFGSFLGKQFESAANDLGFDYVWFSNGFAYTHYPWGFHGELFDGKSFSPSQASNEREKMKAFWEDFRRECPDLGIEVRGTNFTVGMDIASDGCDHNIPATIGQVPNPPCNPPWGSRALGMEMASFLSRISKPITKDILFRFYLNDPWFVTNAWYDYYNRETFDIFTPMSASRLNENGGVDTPSNMAILTIDTEKGEYLIDEANEATPNFIRALDEKADTAGPFTWVYPWDEYHDLLNSESEHLGDCFFHDQFITQSINAGLPLTTSVSTDVFEKLQSKRALPDSIYFIPVPKAGWTYEKSLIDYVHEGGKVVLFGSLKDASQELLDILDIKISKELDGEFKPEGNVPGDVFRQNYPQQKNLDPLLASIGSYEVDERVMPNPQDRPFLHRALVSGGGLSENSETSESTPLISLVQDGEKRAYVVKRNLKNNISNSRSEGTLIWIRGSAHVDPSEPQLEIKEDSIEYNLLSSDWPRLLLKEFGWDIQQSRQHEGCKPANIFFKRQKGAFWIVGHKPNVTSQFKIKTPMGAPLYSGIETAIENGYATECFGKSFNHEIRCFTNQLSGTLFYTEVAIPIGLKRYISYTGFENADLVLYPDPDAIKNKTYVLHDIINGESIVDHEIDEVNNTLIVKNYSGSIYLGWS